MNKRGVTFIYVIATLLIATFIGSALMKLSHHDVMSAGDFSSMSTAAVSARSAMQFCENFFETESDSMVDLLNDFVSGDFDGWLVGKENQTVTLSNNQKYSARLLRFDGVNYIVQIEGYGWGKGGSRRQITGYYFLDGIDYDVTVAPVVTHALYLGGGGADFFHCRLTVNGDTYVNTTVTFHGEGSGSVFNGTFNSKANNTGFSRMDGNYTFNDNVYFGSKMKFVVYAGLGTVAFNGLVGFENGIDAGSSTGPLNFAKDAFYVNADVTNGWSMVFAGNGTNTLHKDASIFGTGGAYGTTNNITVTNDAPGDIFPLTNVGTRIPDEVNFDKTKIDPQSLIQTWSNYKQYGTGASELEGQKLNEMYEHASNNGHLWKDFLVISVDEQINTNYGSNQPFTGKVIFILPNSSLINATSFYDSGNNAVTVIYVENGGFLKGFGGWANQFRGYIHCATGGQITYGDGASLGDFFGAIYHEDGSSALARGNSTDQFNIHYDGSVLNGLAELGIVYTDGNEPVVSTTLTLVESAITSTELGLHF